MASCPRCGVRDVEDVDCDCIEFEPRRCLHEDERGRLCWEVVPKGNLEHRCDLHVEEECERCHGEGTYETNKDGADVECFCDCDAGDDLTFTGHTWQWAALAWPHRYRAFLGRQKKAANGR